MTGGALPATAIPSTQSRELDLGRAIGVAVALALALAAQYLFTGELLTRLRDANTWTWPPRYTAATLLLLAAAASAAVAFRPRGERAGTLAANDAPTPRFRSRLVVGSMTAAALCYLGSLFLFVRAGESPAMRRLWAAGIVLLLGPLLVRDRRAFSVTGHPAWEWGLVALLTLAGFWLRYHDVDDLPSHVNPDLPLMGNVTLEMMRDEPNRWLGLATSGHPYSTHQVHAIGLRLFGRDYYGLVLLSVLAGTATLPLVYQLGRRLFCRSVGFLAAALLAISYTHIHFSRTLFGPIATFCVTLAVTLLAEGLKSGFPVWFGLSGALLSFGMFNYDSARVGAVLVAALALWQLLFDRESFRRSWRGWALLIAAALVVFGPKLAFLVTDFSSFAGRGSDVAIWNPRVLEHSMKKYEAHGLLELLFFQARNTFLTFHLFGDESPNFALSRPMVSAPAAAFLVLGIGYVLLRLKRLSMATPALWVFLTLLLGGVLTADPPFWPHLNIALPAVVLLCALGAVGAVETLLPDRPRIRRLGLALLVAGLIPLGIANWDVYVGFAGDNAGPRARGARYIDDLPPGTRVYLRSHEFQWSEHPFRFFGADVTGRNVTREELLSGSLDLTQPAAVLLYDDQDLLPTLEERYPGGITRPLGRPGRHPALVVYERLPHGAADAAPQRRPLALPGWRLVGVLLAAIALRAGLSIRKHAHGVAASG